MSWQSILQVLVAVGALIVTGFLVWGIREVVATARSVRSLTDELGTTLPGLIEHADQTLNSVNEEIVRVNGVVRQIEEVSDRVTSTTRAAQEIVEAPAAAVSSIADGARRFFTVLFRP